MIRRRLTDVVVVARSVVIDHVDEAEARISRMNVAVTSVSVAQLMTMISNNSLR